MKRHEVATSLRALDREFSAIIDENVRLRARVAELERTLDPTRVQRAVMAALGVEAASEAPVQEAKVKRPRGKAGDRNAEARDTARRLGRELFRFTAKQFAEEMGYKDTASVYSYVNRLLDRGVIRRVGEKGSKNVRYEYVKPLDPGPGNPPASSSDRDSRGGTFGVELGAHQSRNGSEPVAGTGRHGGSRMIADKEVRQAVEDAERRGWALERKGDDHFLLVKGDRRVPVSGTPRNPRGSTDIIRRLTK